MAKYTAVVGALAAVQGAVALNTRVVPAVQFPPPDVCHPQGTITYADTFPPCLSQGEVEGVCAPAADNVEGWKHQRDCMCKGSFFDDAIGCGACKKANALQTTEETAHWDKIFKEIQAKFCNAGTPTSNFGGYWTSALQALGSPSPNPEDERKRSVPAGDTVVENYYKAPKTQGPGVAVATGTPVASVAVASDSPAATEAPVASDSPAATEAPVATAAPVAGTRVELCAAASVRYQVAKISAVPQVPSGPKFPMNSTVSIEAKAKAEVKYAVAAMPCTGAFVGGFFMPSCGAFEILAHSEASVSIKAVQEGAVDFGACTCATTYLANKKLQPVVNKDAPALSGSGSVPAAGKVSVSASADAKVSVAVTPAVKTFSPAECVASCDVPAPAKGVEAGEKTTPSKPSGKTPAGKAPVPAVECTDADCVPAPAGAAEAEATVDCTGADCAPAPAKPVGTGLVPAPRPAGSEVPVVTGAAVANGVSGALMAAAAAFALL
ncbi:hypothetical protein HIM_06793 [Hirsutella minnesotensis 3608]|uniref:Extracellular membrane protein CFEM domain-containing protein n=1 Tax=Hirsutella minnesotensis 3608 TaxID=1043627 RepID=A0A0F7ZNK3_9HYPO|nr:hypothetical protein HIM_06793 [Hirsutella minnesotensis 3608]